MQHRHLEINTVPIQTWLKPEIKFDSTEQAIINAEIRSLLQLGVVEHAVHSPGEFISNIFVRKKKSGKYRMILLKALNKHIEYHHFKMDILQAVAIFRLCFPSHLKHYQNVHGGALMLIKLSIQYPVETQRLKLKPMHLKLAGEFILVTTHPRVYCPLLRANYT